MRVTHQLERLEPMVLHPLHGIAEDIWHRAPKGKWSIAQIVHHLALSVDGVAAILQRRAAEERMEGRRSKPHQAVFRNLVLGLGRIPPGIPAAQPSVPDARPDHDLVAAQFRMGVERFRAMNEMWPEARKLGIYAPHPVLGDLNYPEWVRFHFLHCRHHASQIRDRLRWANGMGRSRG
jgi:hypothetical protein